jgi:hypothetical protein
VQGHEWTPDSSLQENVREYNRAQLCLNKDETCLSKWDFDYLYIRKIMPQKDGSLVSQVSLLEASLRASGEYSVVYDSDTTAIFLRKNPSP